VLGTEATVKREYTRALIRDFGQGCEVTLVGSGQLPSIAEAALHERPVDNADIDREIAPCFVDRDGRRTDTIVLACTHFPLLLDRLQRLMPWPVDWIDPPSRLDNFYGTRVCAVDADGNEVAGIRLPPIAVPLGTYTGWNVYKAQPGELADRDGSLIPFARMKGEREAAGDPRPSLEERYGSREAYVARVEAAAAALVADRLLLPADAAVYVKAARESDRF